MKIIIKILTVITLIALASTPAHAFYTKIGAGVSFAEDLVIQEVEVHAPSGIKTIRDFNIDLEPGIATHIAFGQGFRCFRLELEGSFRAYPIEKTKRAESFIIPNVPIQALMIQYFKNDSDYYLTGDIMVNIIYEKCLFRTMSIYGGVGAGPAIGLIYAKDFPDIRLEPHLAGQILGGLSFTICPLMTLNIGYRGVIEDTEKEGEVEIIKTPIAHSAELSLKIGF